MKIWDINPGYLSRQQLLAEHTELHALAQLIESQLDGLGKISPSLMRWVYHPAALALRHGIVVEEMRLREMEHKSPLPLPSTATEWPAVDDDWDAATQYAELADRKGQGRIPWPRSLAELWQHHSYSVMARDLALFKQLQEQVEQRKISFDALAAVLVDTLRRPCHQQLWNKVILGMWQPCCVAEEAEDYRSSLERPQRLLCGIQYLASKYQWPELWHSTALTELAAAVRIN